MKKLKKKLSLIMVLLFALTILLNFEFKVMADTNTITQDAAVTKATQYFGDMSSKIISALMDSSTDIYVNTSEVISDDETNSFKLTDGEGNDIPVNISKLGDTQVKLVVKNPSLIKVNKLYKVSSKSNSAANVTMRKILNDSKYYYAGDDIGLTYSRKSSTFKLWAPTATDVKLVLYDSEGNYNAEGKVTDNSGGKEILMTRQDNGVWQVAINSNLAGKYYLYHISFPNGTSNYAMDPYAYAVSSNGQRGAIVDLDATNPKGFASTPKPPIINPTDAMIYEMHIRDFSINSNSGMQNKGKFMGLTESGTKLIGDSSVKTGIDSLKELGINTVHILPSFDYASVNEKSTIPQFNWGYDPQNYNVPEGSYSTDLDNPSARIREFKDMVNSLHKNGIRVVMDVVYNHTYTTGTSAFDSVVPGYYYRTDNFGNYTNGSGCGNEVATERPMVRKYIKDSVKYWAKQYGVDGFRFDLMGLIDTNTVTQLTQELKNEVDPSMLIYGEPWTGGATPLPSSVQTTKGSQKDKGFAVFNDNFRGAIKGDSDGSGKGFATGALGQEAAIVNGVKGSIDDFTNSPTETINYVTAHDNLNLWDKIITTEGLADKVGFLKLTDGKLSGDDAKYASIEDAIDKKGSDPYKFIDKNNVLEDEAVKRDLLATGITFTSQGIPFIQAGDEFLKSKYGDHNSYRSPDIINQINWQNKKEFMPVFDYYKGLIELRKSHPAFKMNTKSAIQSNLVVLKQSDNIVVFQLKNYANGDSWKNIVVAYNGNNDDRVITLPSNDNWNVVVNNIKAGNSILSKTNGNSVTVKGLSMMVLYDEAAADYKQKPTKIDLSKSFVGMEIGSSSYITADVKDQQGRIMPNEKVKWKSDNSKVATVDSNGKITAKTVGDANITVKDGSIEATMKVSVAHLVPATVKISGDNSVYAARSTALSTSVQDQFNQDIFGAVTSWSSSDNNIAVVSSNGEVTGVNAGTATITATVGNAKADFKINVKANVKRYVYFKYVRPDGDYKGWNIWVWNTGVKDGQIDFSNVTSDGALEKIEIAPDATNIGFVLRKGTDWSTKDPYGYDRYITTDLSQTVTGVTVTMGVKDFYITPEVN